MKTLTLYRWGKERQIRFRMNRYADNGNLYVGMDYYDEEDMCWYPWSDLTVNLGRKCTENCAFIDINNNGNDIFQWLIINRLGRFTGNLEASGYCVYPEFSLDMNELKKYCD